MIKRELPGLERPISAIGLGCWAIGGWMWGAQDDEDSIAAIHAAVASGVTWVDTAPIWSFGRNGR
jgi:methylglyoxal reductase